jgi:LytS/YehU family sensor histidine kinase
MTVQNYVENAIKHGLKEKESGGRLTVELSTDGQHIRIVIEDNGIGRQQASRSHSESTGLGMELMQRYFTLLNSYNSMKITQEVEDLMDGEGRPAGTRVTVVVPLNIRYAVSR